MKHAGSRLERIEIVESIPENQWDINVFEAILRGLWDHEYEIITAAQKKLLNLATNPDIKPLTIHPFDLALLYFTPGTYDKTFACVRSMKEIGMPAKEICRDFFNKLKVGSREKFFKSCEILKGSELEKVIEPIIEEVKTKTVRE